MDAHTSRRSTLLGRLGRLVRRHAATPDLATTEPLTERDAITASGLFDLDWYSAESGRSFSSLDEAVSHYLTTGFTEYFSPNPLLDHIPDHFDDSSTSPLGRFVLGGFRTTHAPHPAWSAPRHVKSHPESTAHPFGPLGHLYADLGPETVVFLRGPDRLKRVRWKTIESPWRELATTWTRHRRRLVRGWFDELPVAHDMSPPPTTRGLPHPTVSIVISTWNRAYSLGAALDSIRAQTWQNWEALVVDDGSTDNTASLVRAFAAEDSRIRLISRSHEGVCRARNTGIAEATGELIAFLDSDNVWRPDYLLHMVHAMEHQQLEAAYATLATMTPDGPRYQALQVTREILQAHNHVDLNVLIVRTALLRDLGGFDPQLLRAVDYDLVLRLVEVTDLVHIPVIGADYDGDTNRTDRISVRHPRTWADFVRLKQLVKWDELAESPRDQHLVSVVVPTGRRPGQTLARVKAARSELGDGSWEMIVVDHSTARRTFHELLPILLTDHRIRYERVAYPQSFAFTANLGFSKTKGSRVLFLDFDIHPEPGTITALIEASHRLDDPHLVEAAPPADGPAGRTFVSRSDDFISVHGLQPLLHNEFELADLRLRLQAAHRAVQFEQLPGAAVTRLTVTREPGRHAENLRQFIHQHDHEPGVDLQRS